MSIARLMALINPECWGEITMSETDAVRPTGETGARCPWCGSEMRAFPFPTSWAARCVSYACYAIGPQRNESKEAALAAAARPLPDFPAGARSDEDARSLEKYDRDIAEIEMSPSLSADEVYRLAGTLPGRAIHLEEIIRFLRRLLRESDARLTAPARPAAAGLPGIHEWFSDDLEKWSEDRRAMYGRDASYGLDYRLGADSYRKYAESLLSSRATLTCPKCTGQRIRFECADCCQEFVPESSRATGAEAEIQAAPSHDETSRDVDAWLVEFQKGADTPVTATMIHLLHVGYTMGWKKCARRHATIREHRGGGE